MTTIVSPAEQVPVVGINDVMGSGAIPLFQSTAEVQNENWITIPLTPAPPTNCLSQGNLVWFDLQAGVAQNIKKIDLKINITCSNASVTVVPSMYWFQFTKIHLARGSGDYALTLYPEQQVLHYWMMDPIRRKWYEQHGMVKFLEEKECYRLCYPDPLNVGESRDVYIPFLTNWLDMGGIHLQHLTQDLRFEFQFNSGFVISGTAANITVNSISFVIDQYDLDGPEESRWVDQFRASNHFYNYLDWVRWTDNTKTQTQSTATLYDLSTFSGKCPFMMFCIKPSLTPVASDHSLYRPLDIGYTAQVELLTPAGQPILGKGNDPYIHYIEKLMLEMLGKKPIRGFYILPFCQNVYDSILGRMNGIYPFAGLKNYLRITYGGAGTQENFSWTAASAPTQGSFDLWFDGRYMGNVAYNAPLTGAGSPTNVINAAEPFIRTGQTITFTGGTGTNINSTTAVVGTWSIGSGPVAENYIEKIPNISCSEGADHAFKTQTLNNCGEVGWTTSSSCQMEFYFPYFRRLTVDPQGILSVRTL